MNKLYTYFSYNWVSIIKRNIKNEEIKNTNTKISLLAFKKEICNLIFIIINFLITYIGLKDVYEINYQKSAFIYILKDNLFISVIWFVLLAILPTITVIMNKKKLKAKYYLILDILYIISNLYNLIMITYFISSFINSFILGIAGIINIIITIIINANIIIEINEKYLKK